MFELTKILTFLLQVIQAVFFGICVLSDLSCLLTKGSDSLEQERQLKKLLFLRDWMLAVLAFPVGVVSYFYFHLFKLNIALFLIHSIDNVHYITQIIFITHCKHM